VLATRSGAGEGREARREVVRTMLCKLTVSRSARGNSLRVANEPLDNHAIAPYALQSAVPSIYANLPKSHAGHQCTTGDVLREDA
jgi:hypothetical protein